MVPITDPNSNYPNMRRLFQIISNCMMHGPCTQGARCMKKDGKYCSYKFPKDFRETTFIGENCFPQYKRPFNDKFVMKFL